LFTAAQDVRGRLVPMLLHLKLEPPGDRRKKQVSKGMVSACWQGGKLQEVVALTF
jgi:hypothetical protein